MDSKDWLTEFVVTPHIQHAIQVLRDAIPRRGDIPDGGEYITVERKSGILTAMASRVERPEIDPHEGLSHEEIMLTEEQEAAAELLLATFAYYAFLIERAYPAPTDADIQAYADTVFKRREPGPEGYMKAIEGLRVNLEQNFRLAAGALDAEDNLSVWS